KRSLAAWSSWPRTTPASSPARPSAPTAGSSSSEPEASAPCPEARRPGGPFPFPRRGLQGQGEDRMTRNRATAIGFTAILMWSALALLTIRSAPVPPLLLNALCFAVGGVLGLAWTLRRGLSVLRGVSWKVYAFGTIGLFGYHFLYFTAFRLSPTAETGLIAYLWPLFIVLLSGLLPGERLAARHILGALIAFAGAAVILLGRDSAGDGTAAGFALAFACALTWAG